MVVLRIGTDLKQTTAHNSILFRFVWMKATNKYRGGNLAYSSLLNLLRCAESSIDRKSQVPTVLDNMGGRTDTRTLPYLGAGSAIYIYFLYYEFENIPSTLLLKKCYGPLYIWFKACYILCTTKLSEQPNLGQTSF